MNYPKNSVVGKIFLGIYRNTKLAFGLTIVKPEWYLRKGGFTLRLGFVSIYGGGD